MRRLLALGALLGLLFACSPGGGGSILEAGPRVPDEEGVVVDVSLERIVLDGDRSFPVNPEVESFTTRAHEPLPLLRLDDKYVHVGLNQQGEAIWIAGIGVVARTEPPVVHYTGIFTELDAEGRAVFEDGTVLRVADGVEIPEAGREVLVRLDPGRYLAVEIVSQ